MSPQKKEKRPWIVSPPPSFWSLIWEPLVRASREPKLTIDWMSSRKTAVLAGLWLSLIAFGFMLWAATYLNDLNPPAKIGLAKVVDVESGMSSKQITNLLYDQKLIKNRFSFLVYAQLHGVRSRLKAGRYEFSAQMSVLRIVEKLTKGEFLMRRFLVPEGSHLSQIAQLWQKSGAGTYDEFIEAARDLDLIKRYGIGGESVEGYLFPETYKFAYNSNAKIAVEMMVKEFYRRVIPKLQNDAFSLGLSIHELVTLASIIEKEAQVDGDRPIISGVFHNRLKLKWKLEADPTVLYTLGYPSRKLSKRDLKLNSTYNTYLYRGLPPGPICNPGLNSIVAAIKPKITPYRYFVANGDGTHRFSSTLQGHLKAISEVKKFIPLANQPLEN